MNLQRVHSFIVPENVVCMLPTDDYIAWGFFRNIFQSRANEIVRVFIDVSENGKDDPSEILVGEGLIMSTGVTNEHW